MSVCWYARFLNDGHICLTNNVGEHALRGIALGRKSWLFASFDRGRERAAVMCTLIEVRSQATASFGEQPLSPATRPIHRRTSTAPMAAVGYPSYESFRQVTPQAAPSTFVALSLQEDPIQALLCRVFVSAETSVARDRAHCIQAHDNSHCLQRISPNLNR